VGDTLHAESETNGKDGVSSGPLREGTHLFAA
jgi:hypothetical protein